MYLGPKQTSMKEAFCENRLTVVNHFRKNFIINVWKGTTCVLPCIMKNAQLWITSAFYFHVQKKLCLYDYPDFGYKNLYRNATCEINICLKSVSNQIDAIDIILVSLLLTLQTFHTFLWCFHGYFEHKNKFFAKKALESHF